MHYKINNSMKKTLHKFIIMLAGTLFLLHGFVPHHHHADKASVIEHRHIVEHAMGLHDEEEEKNEHHEHHENIIDEIMIISAKAQYTVDWSKIMMPCCCPPIYINIPEPFSVPYTSLPFAQLIADILQGSKESNSLRGPPVVNC